MYAGSTPAVVTLIAAVPARAELTGRAVLTRRARG
jgi:hypothetical protein